MVAIYSRFNGNVEAFRNVGMLHWRRHSSFGLDSEARGTSHVRHVIDRVKQDKHAGQLLESS